MQELKKQLEVLLASYFRECSDDFPNGKMEASESPDFIVKLKNSHRLGIELVRLNPGSAVPLDESEAEQNAVQEELVDDARELFEQNSNEKLFVKFLFNKKHPLSAERSLAVAVRAVTAIRTSIRNRNMRTLFYLVIPTEQLPEGIDEILVLHHPGLETSVWECSNNLGISRNVVEDIQNSIEKKEEKLRLYKKRQLESYWLLITTDRLRGQRNYNIRNQIANQNFHSGFDGVFLFDLFRSHVFRLV
ncbi:hypothetical protein [Maribellus sp. YY47]|uniref:hypothetical protein n=1 Tax=Maribellus sp. YY47 TaxID=2929486 RepID=UPI00200107B3|nr:hypothetical protein [Maribellus sp. YY47]MCK3686019.1 hypothetical protein [Maribellus sp. YY47]